jgi:hypothetical protein
MQLSLKKSDPKFNLLYLDYSECLFNSIKAYGHKINTCNKNM